MATTRKIEYGWSEVVVTRHLMLTYMTNREDHSNQYGTPILPPY